MVAFTFDIHHVFFVVDKLQGFELFKLRSELWVIFIFVKINKILLYRKPSFFDASCAYVNLKPSQKTRDGKSKTSHLEVHMW